MGRAELERRQALLNRWAFEGTDVEVVDVPEGPASIELSYEEMLALAAACFRGCFAPSRRGSTPSSSGASGTLGWRRHASWCRFPSSGRGEASLLLAAGLGHRFSVVTILDSVIPAQELQAVKAGVQGKLASVVATDIPGVLQLMRDKAATIERVVAAGRRAIHDDRADALALGCMTMSFLDIADEVARELGVPVINAGKAALKAAEALVSQASEPQQARVPDAAQAAGRRLSGGLIPLSRAAAGHAPRRRTIEDRHSHPTPRPQGGPP